MHFKWLVDARAGLDGEAVMAVRELLAQEECCRCRALTDGFFGWQVFDINPMATSTAMLNETDFLEPT